MGAAIEINLEDLAPWVADLGKDLEKISWERAAKVIAVMVVGWAKACFEDSRDPQGTPWLPLKNPRQPRGGDKPLRDTGLLMASISALSQTAVGGFRVQWGSNLEYAGVHNYGHTFHFEEKRRGPGQKPWVFEIDGHTVFARHIKAHDVTIPARPFLGLSEANLQTIGHLLLEEITRQWPGHGHAS